MSAADHPIKVNLRIPGDWENPGQLIERMPEGYRLTPESLVLPDGIEIEMNPLQPDDQFAQIFESSCRQPASAEETATVNRYSVNVCLSGPGGSLEAAHTMMRAAAAIIRAGGAGVFIDNSGLAHGGAHWLEMADDGSPDAISYAFAAIVGGEREFYTMGMHVMGFPDLVMERKDVDEEGDMIVELIRYVCSSDVAIEDKHMIGDESGPTFQAIALPGDERTAGSVMHNPFGRLKLISLRDVAEGN